MFAHRFTAAEPPTGHCCKDQDEDTTGLQCVSYPMLLAHKAAERFLPAGELQLGFAVDESLPQRGKLDTLPHERGGTIGRVRVGC